MSESILKHDELQNDNNNNIHKKSLNDSDHSTSSSNNVAIDYLSLSNFYFHQTSSSSLFNHVTTSSTLTDQQQTGVQDDIRQNELIQETTSSSSLLSSSVLGENKNKKTTKLLILFGWLFSCEQHLDKYRSLYLKRGFDVLSVRLNLLEFLWPRAGSKQIASKLARFLFENYCKYDSIIFHAFSIGCYQLGELLLMFNDYEENKDSKNFSKLYQEHIRPRIRCIIYDSPVDHQWAARGIAVSITKQLPLQWIIIGVMKAHQLLFYHAATKHYYAASKILHENVPQFPLLFFLSKDDHFMNWQYLFEMIDKLRCSGTRVRCQCWDHSLHVGHLYRHREEYKQTLDQFLDEVLEGLD